MADGAALERGQALARSIALIGPRCAGKSSVGPLLAELLGLSFLDTDVELARRWAAAQGCDPLSAGEVLALIGVPAFRCLERDEVERALSGPPRVVATGGGCVETAGVRELLRARAHVVWLHAPLEVLEARLAADPAPRPALDVDLADLLERRRAGYADLARIDLDSGQSSAAQLATRLAQLDWLA